MSKPEITLEPVLWQSDPYTHTENEQIPPLLLNHNGQFITFDREVQRQTAEGLIPFSEEVEVEVYIHPATDNKGEGRLSLTRVSRAINDVTGEIWVNKHSVLGRLPGSPVKGFRGGFSTSSELKTTDETAKLAENITAESSSDLFYPKEWTEGNYPYDPRTMQASRVAYAEAQPDSSQRANKSVSIKLQTHPHDILYSQV